MPSEVRELLNIAAPVAVAVDQSGDTSTVSVKGFASVMSDNDRSGDLVPPEEFRIDQFMASPMLLLNHKFWADPMGNMEFEVAGDVHHPQRGEEMLISAGVVRSARNIGRTTARWLDGYRGSES